ncbi:MAG: hypothetical protein EOO48_02125 [Flavobacterium sp.]|nr:MAG: hypothetical protein EOO48_02125 [Flavobacterium sp.]
MKTIRLYFTVFFATASLGCFAQQRGSISSKHNVELLAGSITTDEQVVVSYRVEERINMNFGSQITSYTVSSLNLISTNDLGPNNTRKITPVFAKAKMRAPLEMVSITPVTSVSNTQMPTAGTEILVPAAPVKAAAAAVEKKDAVAIVNVIETYERILDKGYNSVEMLKRVANSRFFDGDLIIAAKWYDRLFAQTSDLEPVYYYRYAQSLKAINQLKKSNEMMAVFEKNR